LLTISGEGVRFASARASDSGEISTSRASRYLLRITTSRNEVIDVPVQAIKLADGGDDTFSLLHDDRTSGTEYPAIARS
jgi:hypothetical protein